MLETLERLDQNVTSHFGNESARVGKLTQSPSSSINFYRVVVNDVLFWLEKWIERYKVTETANASSSSSSSFSNLKSAIDAVMMMDTEVEVEKERWLSILKTLTKWYSYGSLNIITHSVVDALQKTNDEQTNEIIRLDREIKRLHEIKTYSIDLDVDLENHIKTLDNDKQALEYRSESLHEMIQSYKVSSSDRFLNKAAVSATITLPFTWPNAKELRKIDSSMFTLQNVSFYPCPGVDTIHRAYKTKNKSNKYWILLPTGKTPKDKIRMQEIAHASLNVDPLYYCSIVGYVDDAKMMGLVYERCKSTLRFRLSPEFRISLFESRKKFFVSFEERLMMCHKLIQGYNPRYPVPISPSNIVIRQEYGIWTAKWFFYSPSDSSSTDSSMESWGLLLKQILEWRLAPEEITHEYKFLWTLNDLEKKGKEYDVSTLTMVLDRCFLEGSTMTLQELDVTFLNFKRFYVF
jgi:hypothetical protein